MISSHIYLILQKMIVDVIVVVIVTIMIIITIMDFCLKYILNDISS